MRERQVQILQIVMLIIMIFYLIGIAINLGAATALIVLIIGLILARIINLGLRWLFK